MVGQTMRTVKRVAQQHPPAKHRNIRSTQLHPLLQNDLCYRGRQREAGAARVAAGAAGRPHHAPGKALQLPPLLLLLLLLLLLPRVLRRQRCQRRSSGGRRRRRPADAALDCAQQAATVLRQRCNRGDTVVSAFQRLRIAEWLQENKGETLSLKDASSSSQCRRSMN